MTPRMQAYQAVIGKSKLIPEGIYLNFHIHIDLLSMIHNTPTVTNVITGFGLIYLFGQLNNMISHEFFWRRPPS